MPPAAPTPAQLVARLKEVYEATSDEDLARKLDIPLRSVTNMKAGEGPQWERAIDLLGKAGWLVFNGDDVANRAQSRRQEALLGQIQARLAEIERVQHPEGPPASPPHQP